MPARPEAIAFQRWKLSHPYQGDRLHCAGCGAPLGKEKPFEPGDGARVHHGERLIDCLLRYYRARRAQADADGVPPDPDDESASR